ncbi:MAG: methyltransferase domain-containing protein [Caldimicrobium sp.]|nr:methyltransferase domain-containing protein [Caldimicrobium sp.]MCX7874237.1 methyltransferase domain-containing protein [Caldimicrobium sp.]MDW8094766.1 methyltransferase domain-containing protein [Caldimicrobium sp.]
MIIEPGIVKEVSIRALWQSNYAKHEEVYHTKINLWREATLFPKEITRFLCEGMTGECLEINFKRGHLFPNSKDLIYEIDPRYNFNPPDSHRSIKLRLGRFYPLGFFKNLRGIYGGNPYPGRIIAINGEKSKMLLDANVPLSYYDVTLCFTIREVLRKESELGGRCRDHIEEALRVGPGMQTRYDHVPTDFGLEERETFQRLDESDDTLFYQEPRLVGHIDRVCHEALLNYYGRILSPKGKILDLMSSYESHLPPLGEYEVIGLGINEEELKANPQLTEYLVKDLNKDPTLPFESETFDAVLCDLSIEYVIRPIELLQEVKRVLKKGGLATFSFSNRYFPTKVIKLWVDLHEFERMGYVLELMIRTGFRDLHTFSLRGLPRPKDDRWITYTPFADPLYVVWGKKDEG